MLHGLLLILLIILIFIAIVAMVVVRMVMRGFGRMRDAARQAMGMDPSGDGADSTRDYTGRSSRQYTYTHRAGGRGSSSQSSSRSGGSGSRSQSSGRVTIIDGRNNERAGRKIFSKEEGEYVDFEEEK